MSTNIHPTAVVSSKAEIGSGVTIGPYSIVHDHVRIGETSTIGAYCELGIETPLATTPELTIGANSIIRSNAVFYQGSTFGPDLRTGHGTIVRENTHGGINLQIGSLSDINGDCSFGDYTRLHSNVFVGKAAKVGNYVWLLPYTLLTNDPHPPSDTLIGVTIEDYAVLAARSTILPGITIGKGALVAAGSVVTHTVQPDTVVGGVPAKVMGDIKDIRLTSSPDESAYPWTAHFHRGYPEDVVQAWIQKANARQ